MQTQAVAASFLIALSIAGASAQSYKNTAPESFHINTQVIGGNGGVASAMDLKMEKYSADADHQALVTALKSGGYESFVQALKKAPKIGVLTVGKRSLDVRWARFNKVGEGRRIVAVTDGPVYFFGAGAVDAKPTAGFDIGVLEFEVDTVGFGKGRMAGAARVKPGGPVGVQIDDYSGKLIELTSVSRDASNTPK